MALVLMTPFFKGSHLQQQATQSNTSNSLILFIKAQTTVAIFTYFCCQMFSGLIFCLIIYSTTLSIESSRLSIYSPFCSFFIINEARNCSYRFFVIGFDSSIDIAFIIGSMKLVSSPQQGLSYLILPSESWKDQTIQSILQFHDQCLQKPFPLSFQQFHSFWQRQRLQNLINNTHKLPNQQTYLAWLQYHYAYLQQSDWYIIVF